jgi:hypothetical protein
LTPHIVWLFLCEVKVIENLGNGKFFDGYKVLVWEGEKVVKIEQW